MANRESRIMDSAITTDAEYLTDNKDEAAEKLNNLRYAEEDSIVSKQTRFRNFRE